MASRENIPTSDNQAVKPDAAEQIPKTSDRRQRNAGNDKRLGIMPLAVLLPPLGEISLLQTFRSSLEKRYRAMQGESNTLEESPKERLSEEAMLSQVTQWLSLRESEK